MLIRPSEVTFCPADSARVTTQRPVYKAYTCTGLAPPCVATSRPGPARQSTPGHVQCTAVWPVGCEGDLEEDGGADSGGGGHPPHQFCPGRRGNRARNLLTMYTGRFECCELWEWTRGMKAWWYCWAGGSNEVRLWEHHTAARLPPSLPHPDCPGELRQVLHLGLQQPRLGQHRHKLWLESSYHRHPNKQVHHFFCFYRQKPKNIFVAAGLFHFWI